MGQFNDIRVEHVGFAVTDVAAEAAVLVDSYGFSVVAKADEVGATGAPVAQSIALAQNDIRLVLTQPLDDGHPAADYVDRHSDGVADIALRVSDATAAFDEAVARGATPVAAPSDRGDGVVVAAVRGFADVVHTLVQRPEGGLDHAFPGMPSVTGPPGGTGGDLLDIDHFAVCVQPGGLPSAVEFYQRVFDFEEIYAERIVVGTQVMDSKVVQSRSGAVTLTMLAPDTSGTAGQIDEFLSNHGGSGVQHIAFATSDIVSSVRTLAARGVRFLATPAAYYERLANSLPEHRHSVAQLRDLNILADEDQDGQLFQIFARSVHPRKTFFFELIERVGASTFGSGNIRALYEAVKGQHEATGSDGPAGRKVA